MSRPYVPSDPHVAQAQYVAKAGDAIMAIIVKVKRDGTYVVASYGENRGLCDVAKRIADKVEAAVVSHFKA